MKINNFNSERFLKTTGRTQISINESVTFDTPENFVDTETIIYNIKAVSIDEKALATTYTRSNCSNKVTPDHEDLVDCICELTFAKAFSILNDKVMVSMENEK